EDLGRLAAIYERMAAVRPGDAALRSSAAQQFTGFAIGLVDRGRKKPRAALEPALALWDKLFPQPSEDGGARFALFTLLVRLGEAASQEQDAVAAARYRGRAAELIRRTEAELSTAGTNRQGVLTALVAYYQAAEDLDRLAATYERMAPV